MQFVIGLVRRVLELAALKPLFVLLTGNMLSKLCIIKRNFPKSEKYTFNPNNNRFFISENLTRMNESLVYQGVKLKHNNLVNACCTRDSIVTIKTNECSKAIKIHRLNDLLELFPNFDFKDEPAHDACFDV